MVEHLADLLQPLFGASAAAAAIVLFTALVRLLVHPLSRAAARGQKARTELQPKIAELRKKHAKNPEKLQRAVLELHAEEKVSPLAGCLPGLFQLPAFFLLYHLFSSDDDRRAGQRAALATSCSPRRWGSGGPMRSATGGASVARGSCTSGCSRSSPASPCSTTAYEADDGRESGRPAGGATVSRCRGWGR